MSVAAFHAASAEYAQAEARVRRMADARAAAVLALARNGWSLTRIAGEIGVTRARVSQLLARARAIPEAVPALAAVAGIVLTDDMLAAARAALPGLRRRIRDEAAAARTESLRILDAADALTITPPADRMIGEWDWIRGLDRYERVRLARWWSKSPGNHADDVAGRIAEAMPAFAQFGTDEIIRRVWLYHCRMVDAAGYVARKGKVPPTRYYGGMVDVAGMAPSVAADGYSVAAVLGDGDDAVRHVATVEATRVQDEAWRMLADCVNPVHGPAPWRMSAESYTAELLALHAELRGHDVPRLGEVAARERCAELVPKLLDDGRDWPALHGLIVATAREAGL